MKYSKEEIKEKANQFLRLYDQKDHRCPLMLMMLSMVTNEPEDICLEKIKALAKE
jgi:hypothetical protein